MFGCVLNRKVKDKIKKLYHLKTQRAGLLSDLRVPQARVSEKELEESAQKLKEQTPEETKAEAIKMHEMRVKMESKVDQPL